MLAHCRDGVLALVITGNWVLCELACRHSRLEAEMAVLAVVPVGSEPRSSSPPGHHLSPFNATQELFTNILMRKLSNPYLSCSAEARSQIWPFNNNPLTDGLLPRLSRRQNSQHELSDLWCRHTKSRCSHQTRLCQLLERQKGAACLQICSSLQDGAAYVCGSWQPIKAGDHPQRQPHPFMLTAWKMVN